MATAEAEPLGANSAIEGATSSDHRRLIAEALSEAIAGWRETGSSGFLGDVLAFSVHSECDEAILQVIDGARKQGIEFSAAQNAQATFIETRTRPKNVLASKEILPQEALRSRMRELRKELSINPANPFALLDMAQLQLAGGSDKAAERSLRVATALLPNNRVVRRTLARFYVHRREFDRAHRIIVDSPNLKCDPWLIASEVALAELAAVRPVSLSRGRRLIHEEGLSSRSATELYSVLARQEAMAGALKLGRKLLRQALRTPTDNVVAQAIEDGSKLFGLSLQGSDLGQNSLARSNEALATIAWRSLDAEGVEKHTTRWLAEEPFSSRPVGLLAVLHCLRGNYHKAMEVIQLGLRADPEDSELLTNLAFAHAALGDEINAAQAIRKARSIGGRDREPYLTATLGLIAMRRKTFEMADELYAHAKQMLAEPKVRALCDAFHARAASESGHPDASTLQTQALISVEEHPSVESLLLFGSPAAQKALESSGQLRRFHQWYYDPAKNQLIRQEQIARPSDPLVIMHAPEEK